MSDGEHKSKRKHKNGHRTKFSEDTPQDAAEKKDVSSRVGSGLLTDKEALYGAPNAPSGTYVGEAFDANGKILRFIGAKVPLYITPEVLDFEFIEHLGESQEVLSEVVSRGKPPSNEDKIIYMARSEEGRKRLAAYKHPSELFARDSGAKPMLVRDYYLRKDGLATQTARGIRPEVTSRISESQQRNLNSFLGALQGMFAGGQAAQAAQAQPAVDDWGRP